MRKYGALMCALFIIAGMAVMMTRADEQEILKSIVFNTHKVLRLPDGTIVKEGQKAEGAKPTVVLFDHHKHNTISEKKCKQCHPPLTKVLHDEKNCMKKMHANCNMCHSKGEHKKDCGSCHIYDQFVYKTKKKKKGKPTTVRFGHLAHSKGKNADCAHCHPTVTHKFGDPANVKGGGMKSVLHKNCMHCHKKGTNGAPKMKCYDCHESK